MIITAKDNDKVKYTKSLLKTKNRNINSHIKKDPEIKKTSVEPKNLD